MTPKNVIDYARKTANEHTIPGFPNKVCAIIYSGSRVLAWGLNNPYKTHPKSTNPYKTIHAELDAILRASRFGHDLSDVSLYIHRVRRDGKDGLSKPCKWCERLISHAGIKEVSWSK